MRDYMFLDMPVFTLEDVKKEFNSEPAMYSALKRAMDRGEVKKLAAGLYCTLNEATREVDADRFEIATALRPEGFCAYRSALEYYGLANQRYDEVQIVSPRQAIPITVEGTVYKTYRCRYYGGVLGAAGDSGAPVRVATIERTVLDCLDRTELCGGLQEVFKAFGRIRNMSEDRLLMCLEGFDRKILYKKVGFIMSVLAPSYISQEFIDICKRRSSDRLDDLRPFKGVPFVFSEDWNMYVPSYMLKKRRPRPPKGPVDEASAETAAEMPPETDIHADTDADVDAMTPAETADSPADTPAGIAGTEAAADTAEEGGHVVEADPAESGEAHEVPSEDSG